MGISAKEDSSDALNHVTRLTVEWLKRKTDRKKMSSALEAIKNSPLVDLNWLLALAEHYKVCDEPEWLLFKRQQIIDNKQRGEDQNEEMIALKRADHTKMSEMITKL